MVVLMLMPALPSKLAVPTTSPLKAIALAVVKAAAEVAVAAFPVQLPELPEA